MDANRKYDVVIIGGSNAGLSAGLALGRSLYKTLIIDNGKPCNRQTPHSHNLVMHDGWKPADMLAAAKRDVLAYPNVNHLNASVLAVTGTSNNFEVSIAGGDTTYFAKKIIIAAGIKDIFPDIQGFAECWGISIIHCPYCHGYEYRDAPTGILANGDMGYDLAKLISNWTKELTIFTNGEPTFTQEQQAAITRSGIKIIDVPVSGVEHQNGYIKKVKLQDGGSTTLSAMYARLPFVQHTDVAAKLGCSFTEHGHIKTDNMQKTSIPGVYACGDAASPMRAVSAAIASGTMAGVAAGKEILDERF